MQRLPSGLVVVSPSDKVPIRELGKLRWGLYSKEKTGKTSFAISNPRMFVIDIERKCDLVEDGWRSGMFAQVKTLPEFDSVIDWLCSKKHPDIDMVGIDTLDELLHGLVIPGYTVELKKQLNDLKKSIDFFDIRDYRSSGQGSGGWDMVNNRVLNYFRRLYAAGYSWMAIGHTKEKKINIRQPDGRFQELTVDRIAVPDGIRTGLSRMIEVAATLVWDDINTATDQVLLDGKWVERTEENLALATAKGKPLTRTENTRTRSLTLRIQEKVGDSDVSLGSNVTLPPRIALPLGKGWEAVVKASSDLRAAKETSNG